ncbi:MAG TPA: hypothetical protein VJV03_19535 [Pyrinomonadaceae bacterium]|nr:hypothetical protein [Pyrinomonadaceae bacterium]
MTRNIDRPTRYRDVVLASPPPCVVDSRATIDDSTDRPLPRCRTDLTATQQSAAEQRSQVVTEEGSQCREVSTTSR